MSGVRLGINLRTSMGLRMRAWGAPRCGEGDPGTAGAGKDSLVLPAGRRRGHVGT